MAGPRPVALTLAGAGLCLLAACSEGATPIREVAASREVAAARLPVPDLSSADRFGFTGMPAATRAASLDWDLPAAWTELPPAPPRAAGFALPGGAECSLTELPGDAGGLVANVNRWRNQLGLPPWSAERVAALPRDAMLDGEAVRVDLPAEDDPEPADGAGMLGWILEEPGQVVFVKAFGPAAALGGSQRDALGSLVASLRRADAHAGHDHGPAGAADDPHAGLDLGLGDDPHAGLDPETLGSMAGMLGGTAGEAGGLAWQAPAGWEQEDGARPMRVVTFRPEGHADAECYVTILSGGGGSVGDNIDRWRGQLGLGPLPPSELPSLPTLDVLGRRAVLVELEGSGPAAGRGLTGLICPLPGRAVFVKLTGPAGVVAAQRERFVGFCRSLAL